MLFQVLDTVEKWENSNERRMQRKMERAFGRFKTKLRRGASKRERGATKMKDLVNELDEEEVLRQRKLRADEDRSASPRNACHLDTIQGGVRRR